MNAILKEPEMKKLAEDISFISKGYKKMTQEEIANVQNKIILSGNAELIYQFAEECEGCDVEKLGRAVAKTNNAEFIYKFAFFIKGAPIELLQEAIINTQNAEYICGFARDVRLADKEMLAQEVINIGDPLYLHYYAKVVQISNKVKEALAKAFIKAEDVVVTDEEEREYLKLRLSFAEEVMYMPLEEFILEFSENEDNNKKLIG